MKTPIAALSAAIAGDAGTFPRAADSLRNLKGVRYANEEKPQ